MEKIDHIIRTELASINVLYDDLDNNIKGYLLEIESYFQKTLLEQEKLNEQQKMNKPSLLKVSKSIDIARQTLYNNTILKEYIERRMDAYNKVDIFLISSKLKQEIRLLNEILNKMKLRDLNIELNNAKIKNLESEIASLNKECDELRHRLNAKSEIKK